MNLVVDPGAPGAVAWTQNSRHEVRLIGGDGQTTGALAAESGMTQRTYVATPAPETDVAGTLPADYAKQGGNGMGEMRGGLVVAPDQGEAVSFTAEGHGEDVDHDVAAPLRVKRRSAVAFGGGAQGERAAAAALLAHQGRSDFETQTFVLDPDPSVASALTSAHGGADVKHAQAGQLVPVHPILEVGKRTNSHDPEDGMGIRDAGEPMFTLQAGAQHGVGPVALPEESLAAPETAQTLSVGANQTYGFPGEIAGSVAAGVRRLTPRECERLQGFPDDWTAYGLTEGGVLVPQADGARYRQMGNAICTTVAHWLALRIAMVEARMRERNRRPISD